MQQYLRTLVRSLIYCFLKGLHYKELYSPKYLIQLFITVVSLRQQPLTPSVTQVLFERYYDCKTLKKCIKPHRYTPSSSSQ